MSNCYEKLKEDLKLNQYTWLITGVAGFIGCNLLETLLQLDQIVIGIDNFSTGFQANLDEVLSIFPQKQQNHFKFYEGDICSPEDCKKVMQGVDIVLHQAALGSVPRSIKAPELTNATNVNGFLNVLTAAKEAEVKRFVYASSSSVYGDSQELPKNEEKIGNPLSPYAVSKYTNELYAKAFSTCYGIKTIGLRYFNVFGPRQNPNGPYAAVIPLWVNALKEKKPVYINGDGETTRDFCYVDNAIQANLLAAMTANSEAMNRVYNIAVNEQNTLKKLYDMIVENLNLSNAKVIYRNFRDGDIRHSLANIDNANRLLGYVPQYNLDDGLKKMLEINK